MLVNDVNHDAFNWWTFDTVTTFVFDSVVCGHSQTYYDSENTKSQVKTETLMPSWFFARGENKSRANAGPIAQTVEHAERNCTLTLGSAIVGCGSSLVGFYVQVGALTCPRHDQRNRRISSDSNAETREISSMLISNDRKQDDPPDRVDGKDDGDENTTAAQFV
jgi:hypothetical protein